MNKNLTLLICSILLTASAVMGQTCPERAEFFGNRLFLNFKAVTQTNPEAENEANFFYDGFDNNNNDYTDCAPMASCNNLITLSVNGYVVDDAGVVEGSLVASYDNTAGKEFRDQSSQSLRFEGIVANSSMDNFQGEVILTYTGGSLGCVYGADGAFTMFLPVELVNFKATATGKVVQLDWQTASELNNEGFEIQRSTDGNRWRMVEFMDGKGTTQELNTYQCIDKYPADGTNYYRLKQIDYDGQFDYSDIKTVNIGSDKPVTIRPTLVQNEIQVSLNSGDQDNATYRVINYAGQQLQSGNLQAGNATSSINVDRLNGGIYLLHVTSGGNNTVLKFIKL